MRPCRRLGDRGGQAGRRGLAAEGLVSAPRTVDRTGPARVRAPSSRRIGMVQSLASSRRKGCSSNSAHQPPTTKGTPALCQNQEGRCKHCVLNRVLDDCSISGITCSRGSALIEDAPVKGRSCASISKIDAATPVAKVPIAIRDASRLSLWTMAIATRAETACINRHTHLSRLTCDCCMRMRCRRASNAVSSAVAMSRGAIFWPSLLGFRARGRLQGFSKSARNCPQTGRALSHHWPFLNCYVCNIGRPLFQDV